VLWQGVQFTLALCFIHSHSAYALLAAPQKLNWTLIINKQVNPDSTYDEAQDLVRAQMQVATAQNAPRRIRVVMGRIAPKTCELRIAYGKTVAWTELRQK
jgi:hypothetical protein